MLECTINFQLSMIIYDTERYNVESGALLTFTIKKNFNKSYVVRIQYKGTRKSFVSTE